MDDRTLAARAVRGDDQAFSDLFEIYFPRLFRFALRRVADEDAAEDIVQSTLIKAMRSLSSWRGEASLFTWLCTICRREVHDHWQRLGRQPEFASIDDAPDVRAALEALSAGGDSPERALERAQIAGAVQLVLDHLPGRYGDVLEWKYAQGLSVAEIAARLGTSIKAAESTLTRARLAFREGYSAL
ncbi:MAG TPA: RNA polymerase sigma factor [Vicinamibacterales bacterium]|jgi:RNA polymerase sigma-70 factor (ECF subfamily)